MESIDSLAKAINGFSGGMVLVSHDMRLISQVSKYRYTRVFMYVCNIKYVVGILFRIVHRQAVMDEWRERDIGEWVGRGGNFVISKVFKVRR